MKLLDWTSRTALVTGATGIIGSWLVKELIGKGCKVVALMKDYDQNSEFFQSKSHLTCTLVDGCLENYASIENSINQNEVNTVFHLGAQPLVNVAHRSPLPTFETNIRGTYNILEACRRLGPNLIDRVIIASSDKAYGTHSDLPYREDMELRGRHPYEVSKTCTDLLAQSYAFTYQLPLAIVRAGNVYGGGDLNWDRIVPGTIKSILKGQSPVIRSDGSFVRDYLYVKDLAEGYVRVAEELGGSFQTGEAFNFGNEHPISVIELVKLIQSVTGSIELEPKILGTATGEIKSQYLSPAKSEKLLGWNPKHSLEEGLLETVTWYRNFFNDLDRNTRFSTKSSNGQKV